MLNKKFRLTKRKEFGYIHKNGKRINSKELVLVYIPTKLKNARFGFVVSKKIGKAHERNKIKRQLSEIVRLNIKMINEKFNYIFVVKPDIIKLTYLQKRDKLLELLNIGNFLHK